MGKLSKEKQCKCCKEYWWEMNIHSQSGLCPNCYDYVADLEAKLAKNKKWLASNEGFLENQKLKQQLAKKEKEIESLRSEAFVDMLYKEILELKVVNQNQTAIAELEKAKAFIIKNNEPTPKMTKITRFINEQVNRLKGEINGKNSKV